MKLFAALVAISSMLAVPAAADVIYLKNGKKIECEKAWEDGKEVKYIVSDGTVGIPRSMVAKIAHVTPEASISASASSVAGSQPPQSPQIAQIAKPDHEKVLLAQKRTREGLALVDRHDLAGALEKMKEAYDLVKTKETVGNLGTVYFLLKDDWNASLYFSELLRIDPRNATAMNFLGELAWRKEDLNEALDYWEQSYAIEPDPVIKEKISRLKREKTVSASYEDSSTRHFMIKYDGGAANQYLADQITDFLELTYRELSSQFEEYPTSPFIVVLYPKKEYLTVTDAPLWSGGINDGKIKVPIGGVDTLTEDLQRTFKHELAHSFINFKSAGNCPVWLHEGLAQQFEGRVLTDETLLRLREFADEGRLPSMKQLGNNFIGAERNQAVALYIFSYSFTQFLVERYRFSGINALLTNLGNGMAFDEAFNTAYRMPISQAEESWRRSLQN
jgi:hypothetical protein